MSEFNTYGYQPPMPRGNEDEFPNNLAICAELIDQLTEYGEVARKRSKFEVKDAYPGRSMPESDISSGRMSDPTADYVIGLAGGKYNEYTEEATGDTWKPPKDPIKQKIRGMEREVADARNRLQTAMSHLRDAMPASIPEPIREMCVTCGASKAVVTRRGKKPKEWVKSEARCATCSRRLRDRKQEVGPKAQVG